MTLVRPYCSMRSVIAAMDSVNSATLVPLVTLHDPLGEQGPGLRHRRRCVVPGPALTQRAHEGGEREHEDAEAVPRRHSYVREARAPLVVIAAHAPRIAREPDDAKVT